ncbi:hypothetical protein DDE18_20085 [Nocardioides gansuensis]|uniref:Glycosyl hydrolase family 98 putative carbohydrate-binding module domain-containing protein n=1 Tax=Nocardioides gansuensis TaxID=2138300 RepID=A0A2T8F5Y7_9ACTN|nr:DUF4369 domain-containing protein [Nocardioides gansuensis]PVG81109.1 hypothetical protein DDE18_20085 [Nocardioides gansuensis]
MTRSTLIAAAVTAALPLTLAPVTTAQAEAPSERRATSYVVKASINRTTAIAGEDTVKIRGSVKPRAAGKTVILQQRLEGNKRWKKSGTAKIKSDGRFKLTDNPSTPGVRYYRVVKPADGAIKTGVSKEMELEVWAWQLLGKRTSGATANVSRGYVEIGTEGYGWSLSSTPGVGGYIEFTLGNKCKQLRATYALTDSSETGATGQVTVTADGAPLVTHGLQVGTVVEEGAGVLDMTDVFRLRFDLSGSASPKGYAAIGDPEVLCTA